MTHMIKKNKESFEVLVVLVSLRVFVCAELCP